MSYIPGYLEANIRIVDGRLVSQGVAIEPISEDDAGDASSDASGVDDDDATRD